MKKLNIEFKQCETSSYSPWHLDIARKYDYPLMITSDIGQFVKIGEDVYRIRRSNDFIKLYEYMVMLEEMNDKGEINDEDTLKEIDDIVNNTDGKWSLERCISLVEFEKQIKKLKEENGK